MGRREGFFWGYPGFPSFSVPYFEANDFFYSGHAGTCIVVLMEFKAMVGTKFALYGAFVLICQCMLLTISRNHYSIDLITGAIMAHWCIINTERFVYFWDVKLMGYQSKDRSNQYFKACPECGWSNLKASLYITDGERVKLKKLYSAQDSIIE